MFSKKSKIGVQDDSICLKLHMHIPKTKNTKQCCSYMEGFGEDLFLIFPGLAAPKFSNEHVLFGNNEKNKLFRNINKNSKILG